jgi:glycosyltransferase involved in cell wall biosynthesis
LNALLAHPGTQHSFRLARELDRQGCLGWFYTGTAVRLTKRETAISHLLPAQVRKWRTTRGLPADFSAALERRPFRELSAWWKLRRGCEEQAVMQARNDAFQRSISDRALGAADVVVGIDTAGAILAQRCRSLGRPFVLDQSIGHPDAKQAMHDEMRRRFPDWNEGFEQRLPDVRAKEIQEQGDAIRIIAASSFSKATLVQHGVLEEKITVIPYGVDSDRFADTDRSSRDRPFRFAFVGLVTARKGVPLLIEAWKTLGREDAELWLIGPVSEAARRAIPSLPGLVVKGAVEQSEVANLLQQADVFVFPSFFEGFGLVILEAMACGLPVITTTTTAGPDILTEGENGWLTTPGQIDELIDRMRWCCDHKDELEKMGKRARAAAEKFTWETYGERWMKVLRKVTSNS